MAEPNQEEQSKKGGIVKILLFSFGGLLLVGIGLGVGYFLFGGTPEPDPSQEVNQIIEGETKKTVEKTDEKKKAKKKVRMELLKKM